MCRMDTEVKLVIFVCFLFRPKLSHISPVSSDATHATHEFIVILHTMIAPPL